MKRSGCKTAEALSAFVTVFFFISLVFFVLSIIASVYSSIAYPHWGNVLMMFLFLVGYFIVLVVLVKLRQIIQTVLEGEPFTMKNVQRFRTIGALSLIIGAISLVFTVMNAVGRGGTIIFGLDQNGITLNIGLFLFIFFGLFALVLAEIFKLSYEITEENKLTI